MNNKDAEGSKADERIEVRPPCPTCGLKARSVETVFPAQGAPGVQYVCPAEHIWTHSTHTMVTPAGRRFPVSISTSAASGIQWVGESARSTQERYLPRDLRPALADARHVDATARGLRVYTEDLAGPLEVLVMSLARELHDAEHSDCDWFSHNGSSVTSFCRRACEARGLDWGWVFEAVQRERLDERTVAK